MKIHTFFVQKNLYCFFQSSKRYFFSPSVYKRKTLRKYPKTEIEIEKVQKRRPIVPFVLHAKKYENSQIFRI